jgi:hypothetical protein
MNHNLVCQLRGFATQSIRRTGQSHVRPWVSAPRFSSHYSSLFLQAKCEEQAARISAVDLENLQLIDRLHALSTEFGQMQSVIKEQREKNDDLHR